MNLETEKIEVIKWVVSIEDQDVVRKISAIKEETELVLSDEYKKILDQHLNDFKENPTDGSSWEEVIPI